MGSRFCHGMKSKSWCALRFLWGRRGRALKASRHLSLKVASFHFLARASMHADTANKIGSFTVSWFWVRYLFEIFIHKNLNGIRIFEKKEFSRNDSVGIFFPRFSIRIFFSLRFAWIKLILNQLNTLSARAEAPSCFRRRNLSTVIRRPKEFHSKWILFSWNFHELLRTKNMLTTFCSLS